MDDRPLTIDDPPVVIDGGLSTALAEGPGADLDHPLWTARSLVEHGGTGTHPVVAAHLAFLRAGARVLITSSYQASRRGFVDNGATVAEADAALARTTALAREAVTRFGADEPDARVAVASSIGSYGAVLADGSEYDGHYGIDHAALVRFHRERLAVLVATRPDLLACETLPTAAEARAIGEALTDLDPPMPVWITFTCADDASTHGGDAIEEAVTAASRLPGVQAVGVNCTASAHVHGLLQRARRVTDLPFVVYPNAGQAWRAADNTWEGERSPTWSADELRRWIGLGARWIGGCCGVGPAGIAELAALLRG